MFKFQEKKITEKVRIIFLCGTKYKKNSRYDKRNVLKAHIQNNFPNIQTLILEEYFVFGKYNGYLSYDDIFMKNLYDVEELSAAFADGIIIIHDSISTGAELATFATNAFLQNKICVLEPDSTGIEERKISAFLELAFFDDDSKIERIVYYPEVYSYHISDTHIEKRTNFQNNEITPILAGKINNFLDKCKTELNVKFEKTNFARVNTKPGVISYNIENNEAIVNISGQVLLYHIISMFELNNIRSNIRTEKRLFEHVDYLKDEYAQLLLESIQDITTDKLERINIKVKENSSSIRQAVAFCLYMMQALGIIKIKKVSSKDTYKIIVKENIKKYFDNLEGLLVEKKDALSGLIDE